MALPGPDPVLEDTYSIVCLHGRSPITPTFPVLINRTYKLSTETMTCAFPLLETQHIQGGMRDSFQHALQMIVDGAQNPYAPRNEQSCSDTSFFHLFAGSEALEEAIIKIALP